MIQKLRHKFIAANMLSVSLILLAILSLQCFSVYQRTREQIFQAQIMSLNWLQHSAKPDFEFEGPHRGTQARRPDKEFPAVPIFAVELDEEGQVITIQEGPGVSVSQDNAQALANAALSAGDSQGRLPGQNLYYLFRAESGKRFLSFADVRIISANLRNQFLTSLSLCCLALLVFYLISRFLAKLSLQPAERAWEQQRQFVADASHELKTPITVILANTDIVLSHPTESVGDQVKWISYIQEEARRMKSLVDNLLFLAKSDAARLPPHPIQVCFSELVTGSLLPFESVAFESGVTLFEEISPHITVWGDAGQLRELVVILLDNAIKYAEPGGRVTVRLETLQDKPCLSVHNTGKPIPPEHLPHLFERFYRADAARDRAQGGYGLGLSIAQSITEAHRGKITASSSSKEGTLFTVSFPQK